MRATIITIGDEILIGQIVDTNSQYISKALNSIGIPVFERTSIGDRRSQIEQTLRRALQESQVVIITGGLGPTKDDITKFTLADYFSMKLVYNEQVGSHVERLLSKRNIPFTELNRSQANVPDGCEVLFNDHGTAPGMLFDTPDGRVVISLPGVPFEMKHLIDDRVLPALKKRFSLKSVVHRTMITSGIAESLLADRIQQWEDALPSSLHLAYLPAPNIVRLRLSVYEEDEVVAKRLIEEEFQKLYEIIPGNIVGFEDASVQSIVHDFLVKNKKTLSVSESCTGGAISSLFTAMAGASAYFLSGVVSYSISAKENILGVNADAIEKYGVVSEEVARQMAEGVKRVSNSDYSISTTGIAGPSGGTPQKPVGTVCIGVSTPQGTVTVTRNCGTDRSQIIQRASAYAVELLWKEISKNSR